MSLRPVTRRRLPTSPVGRFGVLNNVGKTVNLFKEYAAMPSTHIRWVAGHGRQISVPATVPPNTFVVFMGPPGQYASTDILSPTGKAYRNIKYLRDFFAGRVASILPTRLGYWKNHVYGPGDKYPDLHLDMWDYRTETIRTSTGPLVVSHDCPRSPFDKVCGVKDMNTGVKILYKKARTVSRIIGARGPGI